jgi:lysophospholipase L1-like esterase
MKPFILLSFVFCINSMSMAQKNNTIIFAADAPEIRYAGRIDFTNPLRPSFCHAGVSIKTTFSGSAMQMILEDFGEGGDKFTNYYTILLDGEVAQTIEALSGKHTYNLVSGLSKDKHTLEVFKRTECSVGKSTFYGFKAPAGTVLVKPTNKVHQIEFIGDSFTCGYGNEASIAAPPEGNPNTGFHSKNENHYLSYSAIVASALKTEYRCMAYSGRGMYRNNTGSEEGTLPKIYLRIFPDDASSVLWDVKKEMPEVVVINLGANDFYPEANGDELDDTLFTKTYLSFVEQIRSYYPLAKIVCVTGASVSDYWPEGKKWLTRIQQDVRQVLESRKAAGDKAIYSFTLAAQSPPYGEDWHPSLITHQKMAEQLTPFIKDITNW